MDTRLRGHDEKTEVKTTLKPLSPEPQAPAKV